jgi:glyoxylase-like metal-dependent hydrolase (beta-lactamase superfamily II)
MTPALPDSILVLERGWLSANNILFFEGEGATLVDSGYVTHASQTVALVERGLDGRRLARLVNTHSHSDHIGGNAALQTAFGCRILVPAGLAATIADWDEDALLLSPLGQQAGRFQHDGVIRAGEEIEMGGLNWQALAVPGHDMDALAYYNPEKRLLISGDALWENGFGVLFPELLGEADGLSATRNTLEMLGRLPIDTVIPGHGAPFGEADLALERAFRRLQSFQADMERLAWHAIKVIVAFHLMEKRRLRRADLPEALAAMPFLESVNHRYLGWDEAILAERLTAELQAAGALTEADGWLMAKA